MARALAVVFFCLIASPATAFHVSCDDVRTFVAEHGKAKAIAVALKNGATLADIARARKCLYAQTK